MIRPRRFFSGLVLTLLVSACGYDPGPRAQTLTPLFGETTPGDDYANDLSADASGVYLIGVWNDRPALVKFSRAGRIPWIKRLPDDPGYSAVAPGPGGSVYALYGVADGADDGLLAYTVARYDPAGVLVWTRPFAALPEGDLAAATDAQGNLYFAVASWERGTTELHKVAPGGSLVWRKTVAEVIADADVSANGFLHTLSTAQQLARYKPDGTRLWRVAAPASSRAVAVGREQDVYVAANPQVAPYDNAPSLTRFNSRGARVWTRLLKQDFILDLDGLDADGYGNAFVGVSDPEDARPSNNLKEFYAYSPGGGRLAYRVFDFGNNQPLVGPAAGADGEVYLTSWVSEGDDRGGRLLRLKGMTGAVVWER